MTIRIVNSLTRKKEELVPASPVGGPCDGKIIRMYSCGVTVYDRCHIGHARSLYVFDVIRRYLKYRGFDVKFVRNITDVDDKIINKAKETGKKFRGRCRGEYRGLSGGFKKPRHSARRCGAAGDRKYPEMIKAIEALIQKGFAYVTEGGVYYDVRKFKEYGRLSGQSVDKMMEAVRIEQDEKKKIRWISPFGRSPKKMSRSGTVPGAAGVRDGTSNVPA